MTLFDPKSIQVLGADRNGNNVILCTMYVDTIADLPTPNAFTGNVLSMGCRAIVINDNSVHRLNSSWQWVQIAAGTSTYKRTEIDTLIARIDATEAEDRAALVQLVDRGAKNLFDINKTPTVNHTTYTLNNETLTVTSNGSWANYNVPATLPAGDYVFRTTISNFSKDSSAGGTSVRIRIAEDTSGGTATALVTINGNGNLEIPFYWTGGQLYIQFYSNYTSTTTFITTFTAGDNMISTAAYWAVSQKFVPYAPTNRELYELIQGYHP